MPSKLTALALTSAAATAAALGFIAAPAQAAALPDIPVAGDALGPIADTVEGVTGLNTTGLPGGNTSLLDAGLL
ncbi:hypothetical protein [Streptomyces sp. NBC_01304]|uniref:hypothetical protein n=1 Tax=Streptomyces sp. NBC_01304 TaxID=2903818 RepID=UPI002E116A60|nr:hypothetical protein OG430_44870 [Streptomyces sp. NBC_01304]